MPTRKELQLYNCDPNIAGMARSYGIVVLNLMEQ